MIDLQTINEEIKKLERSQATYPVCQKLADLYVVKDHLTQKQGGNYSYERCGRSVYPMYDRNNGSSNYGMDNYYYDERMMDEMEMGRPPRMSMPSMM